MIGAAIIMVLWLWPGTGWLALLASVIDLVQLAVLLVCAAAAGAGLLWLLGLGDLPRAVALVAATALGVGLFALATLGAGLAGWIGGGLPAGGSSPASAPDAHAIDRAVASAGALGGLASRWFFFALPAAGLAAGAVPLWRIVQHPAGLSPARPSRLALGAVVLAPTLIVLIAAANLPPGTLWSGNVPNPLSADAAARDLEGAGYDALEYHLQVPREYLARGRVEFLPHNVYASFPLNAEMWFLLLMGQAGRAQSAVFAIQLFNVLLAALTAGAVYLTLRLGGGMGILPMSGSSSPATSPDTGKMPVPRLQRSTRGAVAGLFALAGVPMFTLVATIAYVEPMMLLFLATAVLLIRHYQVRAEQDSADRSLASHALAVGLLLGFAAGAKYLAIPLFIGPLAIALLATRGLTRLPAARKLKHAALVAAGVLITFSPWLVRNVAETRNPVFPLMWHTFGGGGWTAADAGRWDQGHLPALDFSERVARAGWRFFSHPALLVLAGHSPAESAGGASLFGPWLWLLAWSVFLSRQRSRFDWMLLIVFAGQFAFWFGCTDMPGRFMLPAALVLAILVGRSFASAGPAGRAVMAAVLLSLALVSSLQLASRFGQDTQVVVTRPQAGLFEGAGRLLRSDAFTANAQFSPWAWINRTLAAEGAPADRPVLWMVGDARPFYVVYPARYGVVFSHDVLADHLASDPPAEVAAWLRRQGIRFVYVDWMEVDRLRGTYGFPASITPQRMESLGRVTRMTDLDPAGRLWWIAL